MKDQDKMQHPVEKQEAGSFLRDKNANTNDANPKAAVKSAVSVQKRINPRLLIL